MKKGKYFIIKTLIFYIESSQFQRVKITRENIMHKYFLYFTLFYNTTVLKDGFVITKIYYLIVNVQESSPEMVMEKKIT